MMRTGALAVAVVGIAATALVGPVAAEAGAAPAGVPGGVDRVLIISVPTLAWEDLEGDEAPNLNALLDAAGIADLSTRVVERATGRGDAYATLGAGGRARARDSDSGEAFEVGEPYGTEDAAEVFARRTGEEPEDGLFVMSVAGIRDRNRSPVFDTEVGALGDSLAAAGVDRAVIANADGEGELVAGASEEYRRDAVLGLMGADGTVPGGSVAPSLLAQDADLAYGVGLDRSATVAAFDEVWGDERAVVLVEASDLARTDEYLPSVSSDQRDALRSEALESTDELVGDLLERVDPERDAVIVVGPYHAQSGVHLTVAGLAAPGLDPGLLRTAVTRRSGFVTLGDVAPTVLDLLGVPQPSSMEGEPFERGATGGSAADRRSFLIEADRGAQFRDRMVGPATAAVVVVAIVVALAAALALSWPQRWLIGGGRFAALALLGFLPATYLAGLVAFYDLATVWYWVFLASVGAAIAALCLLVGRRDPIDPLIAALGLIVGLLTVDVVLGGTLQLNTVAGYSPTVGGRFAGFGNLAFAQFAAASIILAGLVAHRVGGRRGVGAATVILVAAVIVDGAPFWGSDVGGVLTLVPAAGVTIAVLVGWRVRARGVVALAGAALVALAVFSAVDLARPAARRTHLGRLVESVRADGWTAFETVARRKLEANVDVLASSVWALMLPVAFGFVLFILWRSPGRLRRLAELLPEWRAIIAGFSVAAVLGFALNDSGIAVPGVMLGLLIAALVYLVLTLAAGDAPDTPPEQRQPQVGASQSGRT